MANWSCEFESRLRHHKNLKEPVIFAITGSFLFIQALGQCVASTSIDAAQIGRSIAFELRVDSRVIAPYSPNSIYYIEFPHFKVHSNMLSRDVLASIIYQMCKFY